MLLYGAVSGLPTPYPGFDLGMPAVGIRTYTMLETARDPERLRRARAFVLSGLSAGTIGPYVDRTFALDEIVAAHRAMEAGHQVGKIVVTVPH